MQTLFECLERPVAELLEAVCKGVDEFLLTDANGLFLLPLLERFLWHGGLDEAAEGLIGRGGRVDVCVGALDVLGGAFGLEHLQEALVSHAAVFVVFDGCDGAFVFDVTGKGRLFCEWTCQWGAWEEVRWNYTRAEGVEGYDVTEEAGARRDDRRGRSAWI
jgi:hypothetical protein